MILWHYDVRGALRGIQCPPTTTSSRLGGMGTEMLSDKIWFALVCKGSQRWNRAESGRPRLWIPAPHLPVSFSGSGLTFLRPGFLCTREMHRTGSQGGYEK